MKKVFNILLAALLMFPVAASAQQNLRGGYFLDGYVYKYKMNPAMAAERNFVSMPGLANVSLGADSDFGLGTFLYPTENGLSTFLSPSVSSEEFLSKIAVSNKVNMNLDMTLLAAGFRTGKSYHTIDLSMRADMGMNLPGSLFEFMKLGSSLGNSFDVSSLSVRGNGRMELAYGYSRSFLNDDLRVGARAKLLWGVYRLDLLMDKVSLEMNADKWAIESHGDMTMTAPVSFELDEANKVKFLSWDTSNLVQNLFTPNLGFAFDLGVTYDFLEHFTASFSVLDLGMMTWKNVMHASTAGSSWEFDGFDNINMDTIQDEISGILDDALELFQFEQKETGLKKSSGLTATIHAGLEARMPFYERLSFGALYTQKLDGMYSLSEGRLAASVAPLNWLSATTSYAVSNYGHSWGGALNVHTLGFGFFVGFDYFVPLFNVSPQFIPVNPFTTNLSVGMNFTFGEYHGRYPKKSASKTATTVASEPTSEK